MTRREPVMRPATAQDFERFYHARPKTRCRAYAADLDGEVLGLCGVTYQMGKPVAFSDIRPELRRYRRTLVKAAKMLNDLLDHIGGHVYAVADRDEATAPYLLARLGFVPTGVYGPSGEILVRSR